MASQPTIRGLERYMRLGGLAVVALVAGGSLGSLALETMGFKGRSSDANAAVISDALGAPVSPIADVAIEGYAYKPASLTVRAGTLVRFKNADGMTHSVVATNGGFHSRDLDPGMSYEIRLSVPGAIAYFCGRHPFMEGRIVVVP